MALNVGDHLGHYDVTALIGQGGRGPALELAERSPARTNSYENAPVTRFPRGSEVYRGRDTKLNRDVALKVLPDAFATNQDRLARFKREAQVLASLNHPNIASIHGSHLGSD